MYVPGVKIGPGLSPIVDIILNREKLTNLLVENYTTYVFDIWFVASSYGPLRRLFKLFPCGKKCTGPRNHTICIEICNEPSMNQG
jgi:hypothetical protein